MKLKHIILTCLAIGSVVISIDAFAASDQQLFQMIDRLEKESPWSNLGKVESITGTRLHKDGEVNYVSEKSPKGDVQQVEVWTNPKEPIPRTICGTVLHLAPTASPINLQTVEKRYGKFSRKDKPQVADDKSQKYFGYRRSITYYFDRQKGKQLVFTFDDDKAKQLRRVSVFPYH